jgi:hypothetical protein
VTRGEEEERSTMTPTNDRNGNSEPNLVRRTLRMVGLLVAACVIFVGMLSVLAVSITSRAVNVGGAAGAHATDGTDAASHAKKPLSI